MSVDKTGKNSIRFMGSPTRKIMTKPIHIVSCQHCKNTKTWSRCLSKQCIDSGTSYARNDDDATTMSCKHKDQPIQSSFQARSTGSKSDIISTKKPQRSSVNRLSIFLTDASHPITRTSLQYRWNSPYGFINNALNTSECRTQNAFKKPKRYTTTNARKICPGEYGMDTKMLGLQRKSTITDPLRQLHNDIASEDHNTDTASAVLIQTHLSRGGSVTTRPITHVSYDNTLLELSTEVPCNNLLDKISETHNVSKDPNKKTTVDIPVTSYIQDGFQTEMVTNTECSVVSHSEIIDHFSKHKEAGVCSPKHRSVNVPTKRRPDEVVSSIQRNSTLDGEVETDSMPCISVGNNITASLIEDSEYLLTTEHCTGNIGINPSVPLLEIFVSKPDYPSNGVHLGERADTSTDSLSKAFSEDKQFGESYPDFISSSSNTRFRNSRFLKDMGDLFQGPVDLNYNLLRHRNSSVDVTKNSRIESVDRDRHNYLPRTVRGTTFRHKKDKNPACVVESSGQQLAKRLRTERQMNGKEDTSNPSVPYIAITDDKSLSADGINNRKRVTSMPQDQRICEKKKADHRKTQSTPMQQGNEGEDKSNLSIPLISINDEKSISVNSVIRKRVTSMSQDQRICEKKKFDHRKAQSPPMQQGDELNRVPRQEKVEVITLSDDEETLSPDHFETSTKDRQIAQWLIDNKEEFANAVLKTPGHFETSSKEKQIEQRLFDKKDNFAKMAFLPQNSSPYVRHGKQTMTETDHILSSSSGGTTSAGLSTDFQSLNLTGNQPLCTVNETLEMFKCQEHCSNNSTTRYRESSSLSVFPELEFPDDVKLTGNVSPDFQTTVADDNAQTIISDDCQNENIPRLNSISSISSIKSYGIEKDESESSMTESTKETDNQADFLLTDIIEELDGFPDCMDEDEEWASALEDPDLTKATIDSITSEKITPLIKQELKHFIRYRRYKFGADGDSMSITSTEEDNIPYTTTNEDNKRWERKRTLSKESAHRCRQRQQSHQANLHQTYKELERMNRQLETEIKQLAKEKEELDRLLRQHVCVKEPKTQERQ